jgi:oligoribonuclease (3'-5' exoribonuclease)
MVNNVITDNHLAIIDPSIDTSNRVHMTNPVTLSVNPVFYNNHTASQLHQGIDSTSNQAQDIVLVVTSPPMQAQVNTTVVTVATIPTSRVNTKSI